MYRIRHKEWKNAKYPAWTCRIIWFGDPSNPDDHNIRLVLEDSERKINVYPKTVEEANQVWFMFKQGAPIPPDATPFVADLMKLLEQRKKTDA